MRIHRLHRQQVVPADLQDVFAFFKTPNNLETITPPWLRFRIVDASDTIVREGTRIAYRLRVGVIPLRWESQITEYRENEYFVDEMLIGPYRRWYHRHEFRRVPDGLEIVDRVEYSLPVPPLGDLIRPLVLRQLETIFDYRAKRINEIFGGNAIRVSSGQVASGAHHMVLFAHGSNATEWLVPFERVASQLREALGHDRVHLAYLERQSPDLAESVERAVALGAEMVSILPIFLAPGRHVERDLPELAGRARQEFPSVAIQILPIVGADERLWQLVVEQALADLGRAAHIPVIPNSPARRSVSVGGIQPRPESLPVTTEE